MTEVAAIKPVRIQISLPKLVREQGIPTDRYVRIMTVWHSPEEAWQGYD
jgi:hypothetical protein